MGQAMRFVALWTWWALSQVAFAHIGSSLKLGSFLGSFFVRVPYDFMDLTRDLIYGATHIENLNVHLQSFLQGSMHSWSVGKLSK